jgi:acyl carrier protein
MTETIEDRIATILHEVFKVPRASVGPGTTFTDLSFDSLVIVELSLMLDNEFGIAIEDGELTETMTIAEAAELAAAKGAVVQDPAVKKAVA